MEWMERAACRNADSDLFFDEEQPLAAKRICYGCPSREPCLLYACDHSLLGVWGGYTQAERQGMTLNTRIAEGRIRVYYDDL